jgi:hypothetical protein
MLKSKYHEPVRSALLPRPVLFLSLLLHRIVDTVIIGAPLLAASSILAFDSIVAVSSLLAFKLIPAIELFLLYDLILALESILLTN